MASQARGVERPAAVRTPQPFHRLTPVGLVGELPGDVVADLSYLQFLAGDADAAIATALVGFSLRDARERCRAPSISVLNRRRRAARLWVNAVLKGDVSGPTVKNLIRSWIPQLAGTGPDVSKAARIGGELVEYLRGAFSAEVFGTPDADLLRKARALHALEFVLGAHLAAIEWIGSGKVPARVR